MPIYWNCVDGTDRSSGYGVVSSAVCLAADRRQSEASRRCRASRVVTGAVDGHLLLTVCSRASCAGDVGVAVRTDRRHWPSVDVPRGHQLWRSPSNSPGALNLLGTRWTRFITSDTQRLTPTMILALILILTIRDGATDQCSRKYSVTRVGIFLNNNG